MEIITKRQDVLASVNKKSIHVKTGLIGNDTVAYMNHIQADADALTEIIKRDAGKPDVLNCLKSAEKRHVITAATRFTGLTAKPALKCVGIENPTESQINEYNTKIKAISDKNMSSGTFTEDMEPVLTSQRLEVVLQIAYKPGSGSNIKPPKTDNDFRTEFSWWYQDWNKYRTEHNVDMPGYRPTKSELDTWNSQLNSWYKKAENIGLEIDRPKAPSPLDEQPIVPTWVWFLAGGVVLVVVAAPILSPILIAKYT